MSEAIKGLVPEARVVSRNIFRYDAAGAQEEACIKGGVDAESFEAHATDSIPSESGPNDTGPQTSTAIENRQHEKSGNKVTDVNILGTTALDQTAESERPFGKIRHMAAMGDSTSENNQSTQNLFSTDLIRKEALDLLLCVQEDVSAERSVNRSKVLLAGYGFGGIVVKKVIPTPLVPFAGGNARTQRVALLVFLFSPANTTPFHSMCT